MARWHWLCAVVIVATIGFLVAAALDAAPSDLVVSARMPEEPTGTMHYAEGITIAVGNAKPLVLEGAPLPIPGPHFRLSTSRFLLLGWSSTGGGMQSMHALLISVRHAVVVLDRELYITTDRLSAGLLIRIGPQSTRIGFPQPPSGFVPYEDEWFLNLGATDRESIDLKQMRNLTFERAHLLKSDVFYNPPVSLAPMPRRVAWIEVTRSGFVLAVPKRSSHR